MAKSTFWCVCMGPTTIMSWCRPHCTTTAQATADGPGDAQGLKEEDLVWNNSPGKWGGATKLTAKQRGAENMVQTLSVGRIPAMVAACSPPGLPCPNLAGLCKDMRVSLSLPQVLCPCHL